MPLRDHFRPPLDNAHSWEGFHAQWPAVIVQHLRKKLPDGYTAAPRLHSGYDPSEDNGGVAVAVWAPPRPSVAVETTLPEYDEYEVRIYDAKRGRHLVAAIEIVSPANKDRPETRNAFVAKCAALLQNGVAVSIVDLVTVRQFNLYAEVMTFIGHGDQVLSADPQHLYAVSCRYARKRKRTMLETWPHVLTLGQPLPTLPLWLSADRVVPLDLEASYEQACNDLWIA